MGAGGEAGHGEPRLEFGHVGRGHVARGDVAVEQGLGDHPVAGEFGLAVGGALGLAQADAGGGEGGFGDGDLLGAAAFTQVGEFGGGLVAGGGGFGKRYLGVGAVLAGEKLAGDDGVAFGHVDGDKFGGGDGGDVDVVAFDVADGERAVVGAAGEERGEDRDGAEKTAHATGSASASSRAWRLRSIVAAIASASGGVTTVHSMRRRTTGPARWK